MIKFPCQLVEILLLIVLVVHVDLFEHSSSPPERNIKWPKRVEAEQSSYYREYPVAFGQKREIVGVDQSDTANNTLCHYCFQVHPFLAKKHRELPFLAIAQLQRYKSTRANRSTRVHYIRR